MYLKRLEAGHQSPSIGCDPRAKLVIETVNYPPSRELGNQTTGLIKRLNMDIFPHHPGTKEASQNLLRPGKKMLYSHSSG